jgi:hypothetical protein
VENGVKKEDVEAIFDRGDLGPIEPYLEEVATEDRLPVVALGMCLLRIEEAAPALREVLARAAAGASLSEDERRLLFRGVFILGGARDTVSCQSMLRLLRRPAEELDDLFGDVVSEGFSRIVIGMFDGNVDGLLELIVDRSVDPLVRAELFGVSAFLTWNGGIPRERMWRILRDFFEQRLAEDRQAVWEGWANAVALLGLRDMVPLVEQAWKEGRLAGRVLTPYEFEAVLSEAEQKPDDGARFEDALLGYIEDVLVALEGIDYLRSDEFAETTKDNDFTWSPPEPVRNPWRHVGRNDPCPCGSGKKAKKCCLANRG